MTPDQLVEFAEGLARVAASGGGAKALSAFLADRTGSGVLIEDAQWRPLASAGRGTLPSSARVRDERIMRTVPIGPGDVPLGYLTIVAAGPALDALELPARLTASAISVELARDGSGARTRRSSFWEALASSSYHDLGAARDDAAARGIVLATHYCCAALEAESAEGEPQPLPDLRAIASETFRSGDAELGMVERGAALVVLIPSEREVDAARARTAAQLLPKGAAKRRPGLRVTGGFAGPIPLLDLARGIGEAESALAIVRRMRGAGSICSTDELGAYPMLYRGAPVEELRGFANVVLLPLRAYDEKHQTELERTLRIYFASGQNVKTAAGTLNVHRHTVFYRLRQIGEITGRTLEDQHDQLTLRLAMAIDALHT